MTTPRARPRQAPFRRLRAGPTAFILGTEAEVAAVEPYVRAASLMPAAYPIDPAALDVETLMLDGELPEQVRDAAVAVVLADVSGDDRLPLISLVDEALAPTRPLLVSCIQAGAQEQAAICLHRERVIGIGPLGIFSGRRVIEVAPTLNTDLEVLEQTVRFLESGGLTVFQVGDTPGLVLARTLMPIVNEAAFALTERVAEPEAIDTAMTLGAHFPFGPLRWADEVGIDRVLLAMEYLVQTTYEERYRPAPLLRRMAQAGFTGKVAGRGFYTYS